MYFLHEHFINEIIYNRLRVEHAWGNGVNIYYDGFSQHETENFYTYETMEWMLEDIEDTIELLRNDYDNEKLIPVKKQFHYASMIDYHQLDDWNLYSQEKEALIVRENVEVIIDFYQRFVETMWKMLDENLEGNVITVEGP